MLHKAYVIFDCIVLESAIIISHEKLVWVTAPMDSALVNREVNQEGEEIHEYLLLDRNLRLEKILYKAYPL